MPAWRAPRPRGPGRRGGDGPRERVLAGAVRRGTPGRGDRGGRRRPRSRTPGRRDHRGPEPGVPPHAEILTWARERGLRVWGELELGARLARVPYLAVTGTNGRPRRRACWPHPSGRRSGRGGLRQHRPGVPDNGPRAPRRPGRRGVLLPARDPGVVPAEGLRPAEPRTRPSGLAWVVRGLRGGEGADLRTPRSRRRARRQPRRRGGRSHVPLGALRGAVVHHGRTVGPGCRSPRRAPGRRLERRGSRSGLDRHTGVRADAAACLAAAPRVRHRGRGGRGGDLDVQARDLTEASRW